MALWAPAWASGEVDIQTATRWASSLVRPFYTANGKDVRLAICSEALFKYAVATAMNANLPKMGPAFGQHQCGTGRADGEEQAIYEIRAAMRTQASSDPDPAN